MILAHPLARAACVSFPRVAAAREPVLSDAEGNPDRTAAA